MACPLQLSAGKTFSLSPPVMPHAKTASLAHVRLRPYRNPTPDSHARESRSAVHELRHINKCPSTKTDSFVTMHGCVVMNQRTCSMRKHFALALQWGRRFMRNLESYIFVSSSNGCWQEGAGWRLWMVVREQHTLGSRARHLLRGSCSGRRISRTIELN